MLYYSVVLTVSDPADDIFPVLISCARSCVYVCVCARYRSRCHHLCHYTSATVVVTTLLLLLLYGCSVAAHVTVPPLLLMLLPLPSVTLSLSHVVVTWAPSRDLARERVRLLAVVVMGGAHTHARAR